MAGEEKLKTSSRARFVLDTKCKRNTDRMQYLGVEEYAFPNSSIISRPADHPSQGSRWQSSLSSVRSYAICVRRGKCFKNPETEAVGKKSNAWVSLTSFHENGPEDQPPHYHRKPKIASHLFMY